MARGAPDYSNVVVQSPLHRITDLAELAARLGSPITHHRAGNVIFMETFESGLKGWHESAYGLGADAYPSAERKRSGSYSAKLVGGSDGAGAYKIFRLFPYPVLNRFGLELSVAFEQYTRYILFGLARCDGTYEHFAKVTYWVEDETLKVLHSDGAMHTFATDVNLYYLYAPFHTFKLVVDFEEDEYVNLVLNNTVYDLSAYKPHVYASDTGPNIRSEIQVGSDAGQNGWSYIDDIILTQNEP